VRILYNIPQKEWTWRKSVSLKSSSIAGADEEEEEEVAQHKPQQIWCPYTSVELAADKWEMQSNQPTVLQNCTRHAGKCYVKQTAKSIL